MEVVSEGKGVLTLATEAETLQEEEDSDNIHTFIKHYINFTFNVKRKLIPLFVFYQPKLN